MDSSVAHWQKFRPENTKVAAQNSVRTEKTVADILPDLPKNKFEKGPSFFRVSFTI
jgi:hypothetical protein